MHLHRPTRPIRWLAAALVACSPATTGCSEDAAAAGEQPLADASVEGGSDGQVSTDGPLDADAQAAVDADAQGPEAGGGCVPGSTQTSACMVGGAAGIRSRTCTSAGTWGAWSACEPDPIEPPILGDVHYVSASGPDNVDDPSHGTDAQPWRTIKYAVTQLHPGDTLMVRRGFYNESVTVAVDGTSALPITIRAEVPSTARLNGGLTISADHVIVYGLDIEQPTEGIGVLVNGVTGAQLLANSIHDCTRYGIRVASPDAADFKIRRNVLAYNGQAGIPINGKNGLIEGNQVLEVVAFHPKLPSVNVNDGDDADGMILRGSGHVIRRNIFANYADPLDTHNYYLPDPIHNAHADCFDTRELNDTVIEGNVCWSSFHVSKGFIFNGSAVPRAHVTLRNNIFEYRDIGISAYENPSLSNLHVYNNLLKSRLRDSIESYLTPGTTAQIPGMGMRLGDVTDYLVFNNITVDCDNRNEASDSDPNTTGNPIIIEGGTGTSDYNFSWNSDGAPFIGTDPGAHGSLTLVPGFTSFDTAVHGKNDYRLQATSPLIGLGVAGLTGAEGLAGVTDDLLGTARPQDNGYEPGPFEYEEGTSLPASLISEHVDDSILKLTPTSCSAPSSAVQVQIARWQGNREGALVLQFDDSTPGHALCGLEALHSRGLPGTWYVVPGNEGFTGTLAPPVTNEPIVLAEKWAQAPALGQELANHTMHHTAASDYAAWQSEAGDAADAIWRIRHGEPLQRNASLMAFNTSSSTGWPWATKDKVAILSELSNVDRQTYLGPPYHQNANVGYSVPAGSTAAAMYCADPALTIDANGACVDAGNNPVVKGIPQALANAVVYTACFHGILSTAGDNCAAYTSGATDSGNAGVAFSELESFLDRVVSLKPRLWVAGQIQLWKYTQEQQRADIRMHQICSNRVYFDLVSSLGPLYDEPVTLLVTVPSDWTGCTAMQGAAALPCAIDASSKVMIDAVPNRGRILLKKAP